MGGSSGDAGLLSQVNPVDPGRNDSLGFLPVRSLVESRAGNGYSSSVSAGSNVMSEHPGQSEGAENEDDDANLDVGRVA